MKAALRLFCAGLGGVLTLVATIAAAADAIAILPANPHEGDEIMVQFSQRGCRTENVESGMNRRGEIELTVQYRGDCFYAVPTPHGPWITGGGAYQSFSLGRLPVGNYRVRLYYRDLADGFDSRSVSSSESFSVMPSR